MSKSRFMYTVTLPSGAVISRGSNREYSHFWSCTDGDTRGEHGFARSVELAHKSIAQVRNRLCKPKPIPTTEMIIAVTRIENK